MVKKEKKKKWKSGQKILDEYKEQFVQLPGHRYYEEMVFLSVLLQIRENLHSIEQELKKTLSVLKCGNKSLKNI